jgi:hypothetical protein
VVFLPHVGQYVIFGSHLTGWHENDNVYSFAPSLSGPWSEWQTFAPVGSFTFESQTSFVLPLGLLQSSDKGMVIYMGDRWDPDNLMRSTYVWQPLEISFSDDSAKSLQMEIENLRVWSLNLQTSIWQDHDMLGTVTQAESAQLSNGAQIVTCQLCVGGKGVELFDSSRIVFRSIHSSVSGVAYVLIHYILKTKDEQHGQIIVNNGSPIPIAFLPSGEFTTDGKTKAPFLTSLTINLNAGTNVVEIRGSGDSAIIIDSIEVIIP